MTVTIDALMIPVLSATGSLPLADTWGMHDVGNGWAILMILFWAAVIGGVIWLARGGLRPARSQVAETPGEILKRRLADGSLSPDEYEERRRLVAGGSGPAAPDTPAEGTDPGAR